MVWGLSQKNISPIGIDLGVDSIKLLQVTGDDPPQLVAAGAAEIPAEARFDVAARQSFIQQAIHDLVKRGRFQGRRAVFALPSAQTHIQHLRLNKSDGQDPELQVESELAQRLPVDPSCLAIRTIPVGEVFADGAAQQEVICLATGRQTIARLIEWAGKNRLIVAGMHSEPVSIAQAFAHLYRRGGDEQQTTMFIDIGSTTTKALVTHGAQLVFAKTIQVAGEHFNQQCAEALDVELEQARQRRRAHAAQAEQNDASQMATTHGERRSTTIPAEMPTMSEAHSSEDTQGFAMLDAAVTAIEQEQDPEGGEPAGMQVVTQHDPMMGGEMLDCLIDELQLCIGYHASMFPDRTIGRLVFLGGEANQKGLCQQIARSLRLPAQLGDPLARVVRGARGAKPINVDLRTAQPGWAVPLGLCLLPTDL
jgi:Tfp pilus assembly PilM family ATPase